MTRAHIQTAINRWVEHPWLVFLAWCSFLISPLVEVARFEIVTNQIHLKGTFRVPLYIFVTFLNYAIIGYCILVLVLWIRKYTVQKISHSHLRVLLFMGASSILFFIISTLLLHLEANKYPNYLYAHIGISYQSLSFLNSVSTFVLGLMIYILAQRNRTLFARYLPKLDIQKKKKNWQNKEHIHFQESIVICRNLVILSGFLLAVSRSFFPLVHSNTLIKSARLMLPDKFGPDYFVLVELVKHTPESATIIHPPQGGTWPFLGNQPAIRYFLFPRTLVSGVLFTSQQFAHTFSDAYFAEIHPESKEYHWPTIDVNQHQILFDQQTSITYSRLDFVSDEEGVKIYHIHFL